MKMKTCHLLALSSELKCIRDNLCEIYQLLRDSFSTCGEKYWSKLLSFIKNESEELRCNVRFQTKQAEYLVYLLLGKF